MIKQTVKQTSGLGKGVIKQILQEPLEIAKTVKEQVGGVEKPVNEAQTVISESSVTQQQAAMPSIEEQKKNRILAAHRRELEDEITRQRHQRLEEVEQKKVAEMQKTEGEKQEKEAENESMFQKGLKIVTGRLKRRMETRLPKAA